jgi:hypothetical protein
VFHLELLVAVLCCLDDAVACCACATPEQDTWLVSMALPSSPRARHW